MGVFSGANFAPSNDLRVSLMNVFVKINRTSDASKFTGVISTVGLTHINEIGPNRSPGFAHFNIFLKLFCIKVH